MSKNNYKLTVSVWLVDVDDGSRRLETYAGVGVFIMILGIQIESACWAVYSLLYTDETD